MATTDKCTGITPLDGSDNPNTRDLVDGTNTRDLIEVSTIKCIIKYTIKWNYDETTKFRASIIFDFVANKKDQDRRRLSMVLFGILPWELHLVDVRWNNQVLQSLQRATGKTLRQLFWIRVFKLSSAFRMPLDCRSY